MSAFLIRLQLTLLEWLLRKLQKRVHRIRHQLNVNASHARARKENPEAMLSPTERDARLKVCKGCPIYANGVCSKRDADGNELGGCGCAMPAKTWFRAAKCPKGKWS